MSVSTRPNFLYLITDQHRADWLGCYGHPLVKTPNIDRIASMGTRYENFHVASPVCMPNRASLLTGRHPSTHGLRYNGCVLSHRANTFVDLLRANGYLTASIGKSHLQPFTDYEPTIHDTPPADDPLAEAWKPDSANYSQEEPGRYEADGRYVFQTPYYGYDHVDMVTGHGDRAGGHYRQWFREAAPEWQALADPTNELPHNYSCPQAYRTPIPEDLYPTFYIRDRAQDFLSARAGSDAPFFAFVSFPDPHHPFNPPGRYWDLYDPADFTPEVRYDDHAFPPPPLTHARAMFESGKTPAHQQVSFMADTRSLQEAMALSAGMITMVDDAIGAILQTLEKTGQLENTVIVFNSDHGDYLGDSDLLLKGAWQRDSISRVPFIWSDPLDRRARVSQAMGSTIDIAPTILARAGLQPFNGMQGIALAECLQAETETTPSTVPRDRLLIEFNDSGLRMGFESPARVRTLIHDGWRISVYRDQEWGELYDRRNDPLELSNLWDDPQHASERARMTEALAHSLIGQMDESPRSRRRA
ncbi:sulfatase [Alkalilacustris brevis]|uniref:sulfatase family protein n=1 Tax=Alkalilacustris brevis TaxID=2026338 RepID=UPI000E0CFD57|nr:sulfatase-like hydrolase/transferase [Alkalilacustris brevis]